MTDAQMTLTDAERSRVVQLLQQTRDDFLATVEPVTDAQWDFQPGSERWSIGLIVEHLGLVERRLFGQVERALEADANPDWHSATAGKDDLIETMLRDRGVPRDAPEKVVPTGALGREEMLRVEPDRRGRHRCCGRHHRRRRRQRVRWKGSAPENVRGYDVRTGALRWTFHVVPRPGELGADTWGAGSLTQSGDLGAWCCLSADPGLGYV